MVKILGYILLLCMGITFCNREHSDLSKIPTGSLNDALKNEKAFYSIRHGWDYSRAPLIYPLHLVKITNTIDLDKNSRGIVVNVLAIGLNRQRNIIFGKNGAVTVFGETDPGSWFIYYIISDKLQKFSSKKKFEIQLKKKGITNVKLFPTEKILSNFVKKGILPFTFEE